MSIETKITSLELENIKRIKAVQITPTASGLTIVGGKNNQGKTSVLDAIMWILGGDRYRPSEPHRDGSVTPPYGKITLSNGLVVERKGKNSDLKVIDPSGNRAGQQLLNEFISQFALDLPKFMNGNNKEKANTLLQVIGVGDKLYELDQKEKELYNQRRTIGQIGDQKKKYAAELPVFPEAPSKLISASELIHQQQEILARNGENQKKRNQLAELEAHNSQLQKQIDQLVMEQARVKKDLEIARMDAEDLHDESTAELEKNISDIEEINRKVRVNLDKEKAETEAQEYLQKYDEFSVLLEEVRSERTDLLKGSNLPLEGLSVEDGELTYKGFKWDNLSGADQMKVGVAIVRKLNPKCGFVLLDKLEQMDMDTLNEFGAWLQQENLQVIATRVSTGDECSIIIEDGYSKPNEPEVLAPSWKAGEF
ncbi:MAG: AAA family ATPase [Lentihominibacter sp.]|nr:AAA family ATPase [Lentihominibacter sp.]MDY5287932.1 AAA family ATPase [Lentihominibacter sp.]